MITGYFLQRFFIEHRQKDFPHLRAQFQQLCQQKNKN